MTLTECTPGTATDPLLVAIVGKKLQSISREMTRVLERTARSSLLHNGDFSSGLLDDRRRILTQDEGLPLMAYGYSSMLDSVVETFGDDIEPGDVFIHNDTFSGNNQAQDTAVFRPVFERGELRWWAAAKGHLADWGGSRLGGYNPEATDIWQETIRIPPLRIYRRGALCKDVWELLMANTRLPLLIGGDLRALVAACEIGARRLLELRDRHGGEVLREHIDDLLDRTAERVRADVLELPEGEFASEASWRIPQGGALVARLRATIRDGRMTLDYSGTDPQCTHYYNGVYATSYSAAMATLLMLFDPEIPHNEGFERSIEVIIPPGSFLNAEYPAANVMGNFVANDVVSETIMQALAEPLRGQVTAAWGRGLNANFGGTLPGGETFFGLPLLTNKCGGGGTQGSDGWGSIGLLTCGGAFAFDDYETYEATFCSRLVKHEYWPESAGAGEFRGGHGAETHYTVEPESLLTTFGDGDAEPFGLAGGTAGKANNFVVRMPDGGEVTVPPNGSVEMPGGALVISHNSGGGGFGDPARRPAERVLRDVLDGLLSRETAREVYRVVLEGKPLAVDVEATATLRAGL
jgi:N-methylhydantoinase B